MELAPRLDVWCQHSSGNVDVYERGTIERLESHKAAAGSRLVSVKLKGGRQLDLKEELVLPANAEVQDGKADMTELRNLNEATLLHNMRVRYAKDDGGVYTSTGHILIAINPFRDLSIYGEKKVRSRDAAAAAAAATPPRRATPSPPRAATHIPRALPPPHRAAP